LGADRAFPSVLHACTRECGARSRGKHATVQQHIGGTEQPSAEYLGTKCAHNDYTPWYTNIEARPLVGIPPCPHHLGSLACAMAKPARMLPPPPTRQPHALACARIGPPLVRRRAERARADARCMLHDCVLHAARCRLYVVQLHVVCCMLHDCGLHAARCIVRHMLHAARCMLFSGMLRVACCMLYSCMLYATCCMLCAAFCMLCDTCCMLYVGCCVL
jgi:hypothetical protein